MGYILFLLVTLCTYLLSAIKVEDAVNYTMIEYNATHIQHNIATLEDLQSGSCSLFQEQNCSGTYRVLQLVALDEVCLNCSRHYQLPELLPYCRVSCFSSGVFFGCAKKIGLRCRVAEYGALVEGISGVTFEELKAAGLVGRKVLQQLQGGHDPADGTEKCKSKTEQILHGVDDVSQIPELIQILTNHSITAVQNLTCG